MDQPGKVANPARGQLNRENECFSLSPFAFENLISRDGFSAIPSRVSLFILHNQAGSAVYSQDSSRFPRRPPFIYTVNRHRVSPEFISRSRNCVQLYTDGVTVNILPAQGR